MRRLWSTRLQTAVVIVLFLGSLSALLYNTFTTLILPQQELRMRQQLRQASGQMAHEAASTIAAWSGKPEEKLDRTLRDITREQLVDCPGVEGGFYLDDDRFSGYAFPTGGHDPTEESRRNDPPPLEAPFIRTQAQESLSLGPEEYRLQVLDVGPSRVMVLTEPVGAARPAWAVTWVMFRLVDPQQLGGQVRRYQVSVGLALGGIALSLALTFNLGRTMQRQRREQERLRDELRHSEHLAAVWKLLAGVAHEVRNPLAGIRSTVQLWQRLPESARTAGSLEAVIHAVDRLNEIVTRLLYFARADSAVRQPVAINQVLVEILKLLEAQATNQGVSVEGDLQPDLPAVPGSASALRQVFLNLATNALQAMPQGGCLCCRTRYQAQQRQVEIHLSDTGPGISVDDRQHLFEPFFTTRPEGTGLGLALCREIVLQHGGQIAWEPTEGPGTTFRLTLPVS